MIQKVLSCQNEKRREKVRVSGDVEGKEFNGLDFLEICSKDQRQLHVFLIRKASEALKAVFTGSEEHRRQALKYVQITGRRRAAEINVTSIELKVSPNPQIDDYFEIEVDKPGDFSTYILKFTDVDENDHPTERPLPGFDSRYATLPFSFKANCPSDLDCQPRQICPPKKMPPVAINYLAKDYASFRQLLLDRLTQIMPVWHERHVPDLGITLVEILAYAGDYLSYYQDAVATEAYLDTARKRISVRRHSRLVDYQMHEGCNARAWLSLELEGLTSATLDAEEMSFVTVFKDVPEPGKVLKAEDLIGVPSASYEVFEPLVKKSQSEIELFEKHNTLKFYTWGDDECCLPRGATSATLEYDWRRSPTPPQVEIATPKPAGNQMTVQDDFSNIDLKLQPGDFLIFEEVRGPKTGNEADADPAHRHIVRLTKVEPVMDELYDDKPLVEIAWSKEDALPFPLCISAVGPAPECCVLRDLSVARGNVLLVDHGRRIDDEPLGKVPTKMIDVHCEREGRPADMSLLPELFRPVLKQGPLTFSEHLSDDGPAAGRLQQDPRAAVPQLKLTSLKFEPLADGNGAWEPRRDLLASEEDDRHFTAEMDEAGRAHLRFGDGETGRLPEAGREFQAEYRVGNGVNGNVGAERIAHMVLRKTAFSGGRVFVRNPFPAQGGREPEPISEVKLFAPTTFRKRLERAITPDDYARIAMRNPKIQKASATLRWNGSWYEALVAVDPLGNVDTVSSDEEREKLLSEIRRYLQRFRRMGHDLVVKLAQYVPLYVNLEVCALPGYLRGHVKEALLQTFSNGVLPDGRLGFFHPDNLSFNQPIRLSNLIATAQAVPGVESVDIKNLERQFEGDNGELDNGILMIGPLEIARLDNDPRVPENGRFELKVRGGR